MNKIKKTILYLLGFATLLLITTVVINLSVFDEELLPEVAAIKNIKAEPYGENNAFPALIAINSDSGPSLKMVTKTIREHLNQQIADNGLDFLTEEAEKEMAGGDESSWKNVYQHCRSRTEKGCMAALVSDMLVNPIDDQRLASQLKRYESLIDFSDFHEATQMRYDSPLISFGSTLKLKRLFLTDAYINQSSDGYLSAWQNDTKFWRMILAKSHLLITRMVAIATIESGIDSLSTAIKQAALSPLQLTQLQTNIKTLNNAEIDLGTTFEYELKSGMSFIDYAAMNGGIDNALGNLLFQPQATSNTNYRKITKVLKKISALDTAAFYQYTINNQKQKDFETPFNWSPATLYNPMGKELISYAIPAYNDYIARAHDLNGMFHLLKLQIEIALNPDRPFEQVIAQSKYTNPYTLEQMEYNSESSSIYFECMDKTSSCELDL